MLAATRSISDSIFRRDGVKEIETPLSTTLSFDFLFFIRLFYKTVRQQSTEHSCRMHNTHMKTCSRPLAVRHQRAARRRRPRAADGWTQFPITFLRHGYRDDDDDESLIEAKGLLSQHHVGCCSSDDSFSFS